MFIFDECSILLETNSLLHFAVGPQLLPIDFAEDVVNTGESTSLMCSIAKGDLPIEIIWLHNNETVENDNTISVIRVTKKTSTLNIDSVQETHAGLYTCIAKNEAGYSSHSTDLHVNGTCKQ